MITRRRLLAGSVAAVPLLMFGRQGWGAEPLKISHQFPGGTIDSGDFRDRLCRKFAQDVEARTKGALKFQIYPGSSLMKTNAQFSALRKGALDMSLYPIPYAGGEVAELNIGLMPGLVTSYEQAATWKTAEVGKAINDVLLEKGIVIVSWVWQAGGVASRAVPLVNPEDAKGMKVRGGSKEMDMILKAAGASVLSLPSNEIYAAMQTGAADAAMTSSTSLISFRLEEVSKHLTTGRGKAYWFMLEPLLMAKSVFDALPKDQQQMILQVGAEMEKFGTEQAKVDDKQVAEIYLKAGAKVYDLDDKAIKKWQALARDTAWKDYAAKSPNCARLLQLAEKTL
ncbi:MAG: TRAP transporter substrate-binding protein DctP [Betaproteobacteria bacterium]|nr:TRAP transporter substrate-binding protein DctP [Betaproteobacteria bacterium]